MQLYKLELFGHLGHQDFTATKKVKGKVIPLEAQ
jgi:hypothetical protein